MTSKPLQTPNAMMSLEEEWSLAFYKKALSSSGVNVKPKNTMDVIQIMQRFKEVMKSDSELDDEWGHVVDECMVEYLKVFSRPLLKKDARNLFRKTITRIMESM